MKSKTMTVEDIVYLIETLRTEVKTKMDTGTLQLVFTIHRGNFMGKVFIPL